jgi:hypothetical protein
VKEVCGLWVEQVGATAIIESGDLALRLCSQNREARVVRAIGLLELLIIMAICSVPTLVAAGVAAWLVIRNRNKK